VIALKVSFTIPGRPRGKERPRVNNETGQVYTPRATVRDERAVRKAYSEAAGALRPALGPVKLTVIGVFAIPASWPPAVRAAALEAKVWHVARGQLDLDNAVKLVADALNRVAYVDDAQIAVITAGKRFGQPARLDVTIERLPQDRAAVTPGQRALEQRVAEEGWDKVLNVPARKSNPSKTERTERRQAVVAAKVRAPDAPRPKTPLWRRGRR
jgi:Holliday junction resolvase RusA-like endonuclease